MARGELQRRESRTQEPSVWRPLSELTRVERAMSRLFEDVFGRPFETVRQMEQTLMPPIEIQEQDDALLVRAELPGIKRGEVEISINGNLLTIRAEKRDEREQHRDEEGYYYSECLYGRFVRALELPNEVQADTAQARFENGVLEVRLPKTEQAKRKEIKIPVSEASEGEPSQPAMAGQGQRREAAPAQGQNRRT